MVNCAVPSCKNDSRRQTKQKSNVTFHRFPRNEELLNKWVDAVKRSDWEPTIRSFVCSMHFHENSMYLSKSGLRKLVQDAVPQLLIHNEPQKQKKKKTKSKVAKTLYSEVFSLDKVKKEREPRTNSDDNRELKKRILNLTKLSKRRRLRCNALYASLNRIRKKVTNVVETLKGLQAKISENKELGRVLESYGVSPTELFQGLGNRERSPSPETQEEEFFYEIPEELSASPPPGRRMAVHTTSYPPLAPHPPPPPPGQASLVKTEETSPLASPAPIDILEPVFVDTCAACDVCAPPVASLLEPELRPLYEL